MMCHLVLKNVTLLNKDFLFFFNQKATRKGSKSLRFQTPDPEEHLDQPMSQFTNNNVGSGF